MEIKMGSHLFITQYAICVYNNYFCYLVSLMMALYISAETCCSKTLLQIRSVTYSCYPQFCVSDSDRTLCNLSSELHSCQFEQWAAQLPIFMWDITVVLSIVNKMYITVQSDTTFIMWIQLKDNYRIITTCFDIFL